MFHDVMAPERALPWLGLAFAVGYLFGSIPIGIIVAKVRGLGDLTRIGSGNIGATNVLRTGDRWAAAATLILDAGKAAAPVLVFAAWGPLASMAAGLGAFIGHCWPVWLRFKGGKGVAGFLGIMLALHWPTGLACIVTWLAAAWAFRISSVSALTAATLAPVYLVFFDRWEAVLFAIAIAVLIYLRHAANLGRLARGEEPRFGQKP